jgi:hypothetical protein
MTSFSIDKYLNKHAWSQLEKGVTGNSMYSQLLRSYLLLMFFGMATLSIMYLIVDANSKRTHHLLTIAAPSSELAINLLASLYQAEDTLDAYVINQDDLLNQKRKDICSLR